jgi:DNA polymerase III delta prime subunit
MENLKLLKNREYDLADWENLLEEIEYIAERELKSLISLMTVIMEHLYKWEKFREEVYVGGSWKNSIINARNEIKKLFINVPSLRQKAEQKESLEKAWQYAIINLVGWFEEAEDLAKKYFGRFPTEEDFPQKCPYTFE